MREKNNEARQQHIFLRIHSCVSIRHCTQSLSLSFSVYIEHGEREHFECIRQWDAVLLLLFLVGSLPVRFRLLLFVRLFTCLNGIRVQMVFSRQWQHHRCTRVLLFSRVRRSSFKIVYIVSNKSKKQQWEAHTYIQCERQRNQFVI